MQNAIVLVLLFLRSSELVLSSISRHHRDRSFLNHVQLVHEFRCFRPQPRAVPVEELLTIGPDPDEIFYPTSTVLARCGNSGCCPEAKQICGPIVSRNLSLVFTVQHKVDRQRDRHHEIIHVVEHIECSCIDIDPLR